ncbi:MAG: L-rhamnose mutarotase [Chloroflexi bacterium]|nr:L-rhamnose mutarotase [Chloroflexota bacterium]
MERVGFLLKVKEKFINEYKEHHLDVWPKMKSALTKHGWKNYSLFMRSDGLMFGYFESTKSFSASLKGMSNEEINKEWHDLMSPYFEIPDGSAPDKSMIELEEVFHLD